MLGKILFFPLEEPEMISNLIVRAIDAMATSNFLTEATLKAGALIQLNPITFARLQGDDYFFGGTQSRSSRRC